MFSKSARPRLSGLQRKGATQIVPTTGRNRTQKLFDGNKHSNDKQIFWGNIIRAVEAEPRDVSSIRGASGIEHPLLAAGVDESRNRLVLISKDHEARSAAMMQADVQSAFDSTRVVVARPLLLSISEIARSISLERISDRSDSALDLKLMSGLSERLFKSRIDLLDSGGWLQYMQASLEVFKACHIGPSLRKESEKESLNKLLNVSPDEDDEMLGLCPIPIYRFSDSDYEVIAGGNIEATRDVLRRLHVLQYFFPAADNLALGVVDRVITSNIAKLEEQVSEAPNLGHPFGVTELTSSGLSVPQMIDELRDRHLIVEGEVGLELTPEGQSIRQTIRFKPREGLLSKIVNRFSVNIDLKDLFR